MTMKVADEFLERTLGRCKQSEMIIIAQLMNNNNPCDGCELEHDRKECGGQ